MKCCLFAVYIVLFTLFRLVFSFITLLTYYHWTFFAQPQAAARGFSSFIIQNAAGKSMAIAIQNMHILIHFLSDIRSDWPHR